MVLGLKFAMFPLFRVLFLLLSAMLLAYKLINLQMQLAANVGWSYHDDFTVGSEPYRSVSVALSSYFLVMLVYFCITADLARPLADVCHHPPSHDYLIKSKQNGRQKRVFRCMWDIFV